MAKMEASAFSPSAFQPPPEDPSFPNVLFVLLHCRFVLPDFGKRSTSFILDWMIAQMQGTTQCSVMPFTRRLANCFDGKCLTVSAGLVSLWTLS